MQRYILQNKYLRIYEDSFGAKRRDVGQNHLLTNFVKTIFPKLISQILPI